MRGVRFGRLVCALLAGVLCVALPARAQDVQRIVAVVNDQPISAYDLDTRETLVIRLSGLPDTARTRQRIGPDVLRALINEQLQLQEAKRRSIKVTQADLDRAIANLARQNHMDVKQFHAFLAAHRAPEHSLMDQIRAQIAWYKLIDQRLRPRIQIGDDEVEEERQRILARRDETEYRLSEIYIDVPRPEDEPEMRRSIERLADQIRQGANFQAVARQFSQSATASVGGDLGWLVASEMRDAVRAVATKLHPGETSGPIRTISGYLIVKLQDRRRGSTANASQIKLKIGQIYLPYPPDADPATIQRIRQRVIDTAGLVGDCSELSRVAKTAGSTRSAGIASVTLADLSGSIRRAVEPLQAGEKSQPIKSGSGWLVLLVCDRQEPKIEPPSLDDVREQLARKRLDLLARQYLRDIRRSALIDVRA